MKRQLLGSTISRSLCLLPDRDSCRATSPPVESFRRVRKFWEGRQGKPSRKRGLALTANLFSRLPHGRAGACISWAAGLFGSLTAWRRWRRGCPRRRRVEIGRSRSLCPHAQQRVRSRPCRACAVGLRDGGRAAEEAGTGGPRGPECIERRNSSCSLRRKVRRAAAAERRPVSLGRSPATQAISARCQAHDAGRQGGDGGWKSASAGVLRPQPVSYPPCLFPFMLSKIQNFRSTL